MPIFASRENSVRNEASLRRLAAMDIDVFVPRASNLAAADAPEREARAPAKRARVVLLARADDASMLAHVRRAFAMAGLDGAIEQHADPARLVAADGLVVFGKSLAREAGAAVPADRAAAIAWIFAAELAAVAGDAAAKRALWSECRRLIRKIGPAPRAR
jgi:hypothetical protein